MYECFLINGLLNTYISLKTRIALFKDVLDFDLQPHQGKEPWSLEYTYSRVTMVQIWMVSDKKATEKFKPKFCCTF